MLQWGRCISTHSGGGDFNSGVLMGLVWESTPLLIAQSQSCDVVVNRPGSLSGQLPVEPELLQQTKVHVRFSRKRRGSKPGTDTPHGFQRGEMSWFPNAPGGRGGT